MGLFSSGPKDPRKEGYDAYWYKKRVPKAIVCNPYNYDYPRSYWDWGWEDARKEDKEQNN